MEGSKWDVHIGDSWSSAWTGARSTSSTPSWPTGELPFLKSLVHQGVRAPLRSVYPAKTIPAWYWFRHRKGPRRARHLRFADRRAATRRHPDVPPPDRGVLGYPFARGREGRRPQLPVPFAVPAARIRGAGNVTGPHDHLSSGDQAEIQTPSGKSSPPNCPSTGTVPGRNGSPPRPKRWNNGARSRRRWPPATQPGFLFALFRETNRVEHQLWSELRPAAEIPEDLDLLAHGGPRVRAGRSRLPRGRGPHRHARNLGPRAPAVIQSDFLTNRWLAEERFLVFAAA